MRLLFDEQLSEELSILLRDVFPDSLHIRQVRAGGSPDSTVWQLAKERDCLLVTKDEDFHRLSILRGAPPKVVWLNRRKRPFSNSDEAARHALHTATPALSWSGRRRTPTLCATYRLP